MARPSKRAANFKFPQQHMHVIVSQQMIVFFQQSIDRDTDEYQENCMQAVGNFPHIFFRARSCVLTIYVASYARGIAQSEFGAVR